MQAIAALARKNPALFPVLFVFAVATIVTPCRAETPPMSATVTEVKNDVRTKPEKKDERPAKVSDVIAGSDVLRTGERSLAEIEFSNKTIARLGSKSVFTIGSAGEFRVEKGLTLISVPKGQRGGRIVTSAITAAIEGTTVIAQEVEIPPKTPGGKPRRAAKMIFLEGNGRILDPTGNQSIPIKAGQMIVQFADTPKLGKPREIDIEELLQGAAIIHGFSRNLPTMPAINDVITGQRTDVSRGVLVAQGKAAPPAEVRTAPDAPFNQSSIQNSTGGLCRDVGGGFFLCTVPMPGFTCAPAEGGGFVCVP